MRVGQIVIPRCFDNGSLCCFIAASRMCVVEGDQTSNNIVWTADKHLVVPRTISDRASKLHKVHQEPFKLSRIAASYAMSSLSDRKGYSSPQEPPFVFIGTREEALRDFNMHLSMSHEALIGGALAWRADTTAARDAKSLEMPVFALDIADVLDIDRVSCSFSERLCRFLTPSAPPQGSFSESHPRNNEALARELHIPLDLLSSTLESQNVSMKGWWSSFSVPHPVHAVSQFILAQRWSLRECCVKLLGISNRAFNYACVECDKGISESVQSSNELRHGLPSDYWHPNTVYVAHLVGEEQTMFESCGLVPELQVISFFERLKTVEGEVRPVVITIASCKRLNCQPEK
ncbi:unnamed protein product [Phytomonas sp. Hart1]|nr:unnamed protein product [Phytomonas sp. Hart1]|eukprot:CCW70577.1 unnamed protein product [Phytomonas sp. isolate Hart1]